MQMERACRESPRPFRYASLKTESSSQVVDKFSFGDR